MWKNCSAPETITKGVEKLYGRKDFFIYTGYPPPISYSPNFSFDLQRFAEVTVTEKEESGTKTYTVGTKKITESSEKYIIDGRTTQYDTLEDAIAAAANANFVVTKSTTSGQGDAATTTKTYTSYNSAEDFKSENLTTSETGASITAIKVYGDVTLTGDTSVSTQITVEKNATLNLGSNTLTINNDTSGIYVKDGATLTVNGTGSIEHTLSSLTSATIPTKPADNAEATVKTQYHTDYAAYIKVVKETDAPREKAAIKVGNSQGNNRYGVGLTVASGVTVKSNSSAINVGNGGNVTINGTVESSKSCGIYVGNYNKPSTVEYVPAAGEGDSKNLNDDIELTITGTVKSAETSCLPALQVSGNLSYNTVTINVENGSKIEFTNPNTEFTAAGKAYGNPDAIYAGGNVVLNVKPGSTITSTGTGVELRAGSLNVTGGTITSTATSYKVNTNAGASSGGQVYGAAVALSQHTTGKDVITNISGENTSIKGQVALAVENAIKKADGASEKIEANINGGTFESTATDVAAIAAKAADSRSTIKITGSTTFIGNLETTFAITEDSKSAGITIAENATVTVAKKVVDETTGQTEIVTVAEYTNDSFTFTEKGKDEKGEDATLTSVVDEGWFKGKLASNANTVFYLEKKTTGTGVDQKINAEATAIVAPKKVGAAGSQTDSTDTLTLTTSNLTATSLAVDMTDSIFGGLSSTFKTFDASDASVTKPIYVIGNANITAITGGAGNDTLKAGSAGVVLSGGKGNNLLQGGDGKDTFIHTAGTEGTLIHDTIDNYDIANDTVIVTNELPTDLATGISYNSTSSEFVVSLGGGVSDSLTFNSAEQIKLTHKYTLETDDSGGEGGGDESNNVSEPANEESPGSNSKEINDVYYYKADRVIKNDKEATLGSAFKEKTFNVNKLSSAHVNYSSVATIDAQAVQTAVNITGNSESANSIIGAKGGGNIVGGDKNDVLQASGGSTTLNGGDGSDILIGTDKTDDKNIYEEFVFTGGDDVIQKYDTGDLVVVRNLKMADASYKVTQEAGDSSNKTDIVLDFGSDTLTIEDVDDKNVSVRGGYTYNKNYFAHNKGITLAAGYDVKEAGKGYSYFNGKADSLSSSYVTINAAAVTSNISIVGNDNNNYIVGSTVTPAADDDAIIVTLNGGAGNDRFDVNERYVDSENKELKSTKYVFEHSAGKDEVFGFNQDKDTLGIKVADIKSAKAGNSKLTFTIDKDNSVVLRGDDDITKVNLNEGNATADYLTKDGYVNTTNKTLKLFSSAKGRIELGDDIYTLASGAIGEVDATSVEKQSVTLVAGSTGGTFKFNGTNKKRDGFVYGGGQVSISGYEDGKDRIDLNGASLTSFTVGKKNDSNNTDVVLNIGGGTGSISIAGAAGDEVLLRDGSSRSFKKMVFAESGILQNKAKNPTMATVSSGATEYSATGTKASVKKIFVTDIAEAANIQAGSKNNTIIDANKAAKSVTLSGDKKNDKLIGNTANADTFVYSAGKDIIQNFVDTGDAKDQISLSSDQFGKLGEAKITAGSKSIKFKFANKDTLTIKATKGSSLSGALAINTTKDGEDTLTTTNYTYTKNAIADGGKVTLTSAFSGTFKTDDKKLAPAATNVDGTRVEKNLTFKGTEASETLSGGKKKNTFKGGGGDDTFTGGSGKDIFFYAKSDKGTTTIADFEFGANKDRLKIASGTIGEISTVKGADDKTAIQFAMNSGKKGDTSNIGWFKITSGKDGADITPGNVAIKANNTYYWFAEKEITAEGSNDVLAEAGQLITSDTRVSSGDVSGFEILELNYSTNLAKSGVAIKVAGVKPTKAS